MHELPIAEKILNLALENARAEGASRITDLHLVLGPFSAVTEDSIRFYWDMLSRDSVAAGARLHFRPSPAKLRCEACGREHQPVGASLSCPECQSLKATILQGDEFFLESIDIKE